MILRIGQSEHRLSLHKQQNATFRMAVSTGNHPTLNQSIIFPQRHLTAFLALLETKSTGNLHVKHWLFRHSLSVYNTSATTIEISRNIEWKNLLLIDEKISVTLYADDVTSLIENIKKMLMTSM